MNPVAPVTKYVMAGQLPAGNHLGQSACRTTPASAAEHDLVPARDRGAAAGLLDRTTRRLRREVAVAVARLVLVERRPRRRPPRRARSRRRRARRRLLEEGLDRLVGDAEHVVTERELVGVLGGDGRRAGGRPARARSSATGSGTSPTSQRASSLSRTTKLPGWSKVSSARPSRPWIVNRPVSAQRPSSRRQASQAITSGSMLRSWRWPVIASPRVRAPCGASPAGRRIDDRWARSATCSRSASTGAAYGMTFSTVVLAAAATDSGVSPARILAWMSRGRSMLSIWVSTLGTGFSGRVAGCTPRAARSRASISTVNSVSGRVVRVGQPEPATVRGHSEQREVAAGRALRARSDRRWAGSAFGCRHSSSWSSVRMRRAYVSEPPASGTVSVRHAGIG